jgi:hypothetical protein
MHLFVLIVQLIMLGEDIDSWIASIGSDHLNKLTNMNNSIERQMVQLNLEFVQNIHKNWMRWHTKPCSKKVLKDDNFVHSRLRHRLCAGASTISLGEIPSITLH